VEWFVRTPDSRILAVEDAGDRDGRPVMVHVGTPNSRRLYGRTVADAAARGLRLISYDRPGYGDSTPYPGYAVADCASDVRTICAALGIGRLAMWGLSGGGPYLLACAALLSDLVAAAACLCSIAPYDAEGLDWFAGLNQAAIDETRLMLADPTASRATFEQERQRLLAESPGELAREWQAHSPDADLAFLTEEAVSVQRALSPGIDGSWDDCRAQIAPWGFELSQISVPVLLLHGRQDEAVPFSHGQWLAQHIPAVEAWLLDNEGHGTLRENHIGQVHAWLADRL
jgi:pimeloyl-ACP methyl ester carboxylesterase